MKQDIPLSSPFPSCLVTVTTVEKKRKKKKKMIVGVE